MTDACLTPRFLQWNRWTHGVSQSIIGKVLTPFQLLWAWFTHPKWPLNPPLKVTVRVEMVHKPDSGDRAKPRPQWLTPGPQNIFRFTKHVNRKRDIPGIMTQADHGQIIKKKNHIDVDLVVNYHCDYYIRNGESVDTTQSVGHFVVLNTNNAIVSNIHALHALKHEAFRRITSSGWMRQFRDPVKSVKALCFEISSRNTWDNDIWSVLDPEEPMNNLCMAGWNVGKERPIAEIWISVTLQSNQIINRYNGTKTKQGTTTRRAYL